MSVSIKINHAVKRYGNNTVIPDLCLDIKNGEFFTLLGPSGCGKTTLLRMIAGFNSIEGGDFYFDDERINTMDAAKRNIGMVFQNYAIFPHLTVANNVKFGLKQKKVPKNKIIELSDKFMDLMQIREYANRKPERLSGGQQQRVALARALCIEPQVLLMDEPLSNLDAKLRVEMRTVIKNVQNEVGITCVYVTHDQEEAMAVSDRIAVMNQGIVQHVGTPKAVYQRPANLFVATFIGRSNIMNGQLSVEDGMCRLTFTDGHYSILLPNVQEQYKKNQKVTVCIRPEEFVLDRNNKDSLRAIIKDSVFLGLNTHYFVMLDTGEEAEIIQESSVDSIIEKGTEIYLTVNEKKINVFTQDGSDNILEGVEDDSEQYRLGTENGSKA